MRRAIEFILGITICAVFFMVTGCAEIRLNSIPDPPQTNMLRVSIIPVTGHRDQNRGLWAMPEREFAEISYIHTAKLLEEIGFYEIISPEDVRRATGGQEIDAWKWEKNGWQLAKDAGRSLHADYLLMVKREFSGLLSIKLVLINVLTGRQYEVFDHTSGAVLSERSAAVVQFRRQIGEAYREIFRQAKGDMLATAVRKKGGGKEGPDLSVHGASPEGKERVRELVKDRPPEHVKTEKADRVSERIAGLKKPQSVPATLPPEGRPQPDNKWGAYETGAPRQRLVVYDLQTNEPLNTVALILSEALREEFSTLGRFDMINRADINQALQEFKLQQSGLSDDQQALQIGKWLIANRTISGSLGVIGSSLILQSRMTDLQTMKTISHGSIRTGIGKEEELLDLIPVLARKLCGQ